MKKMDHQREADPEARGRRGSSHQLKNKKKCMKKVTGSK